MEMYLKKMKSEWLSLLEQTEPHIRQLTAEIAVANARTLCAEFYKVVLADPHAEEFLSNEQVEKQLKSALERWIIDILSCKEEDIDRLLAATAHCG